MTQHFTKNTVSASFFCGKCNRNTQHRIDGGRKGPCLECIERQDQAHDRTTEAQFTLCRQHLRQETCPICERHKDRNKCFCVQCYRALPKSMQGPLWLDRMDKQSLITWAQNYTAAKDWLRKHGMDVKSGNLFEAIT